jgi:hypothetical protein
MSSLFALECALPRAYWNGFLKLSLVSCPVALYAATTAAERLARKRNKPDGCFKAQHCRRTSSQEACGDV